MKEVKRIWITSKRLLTAFPLTGRLVLSTPTTPTPKGRNVDTLNTEWVSWPEFALRMRALSDALGIPGDTLDVDDAQPIVVANFPTKVEDGVLYVEVIVRD